MLTIGIILYVVVLVGVVIWAGFENVNLDDGDICLLALWPITIVCVIAQYICSAPYNFGKWLKQRRDEE